MDYPNEEDPNRKAGRAHASAPTGRRRRSHTTNRGPPQNISARPRKRETSRTTRQAGLFRPLQNVHDADIFHSNTNSYPPLPALRKASSILSSSLPPLPSVSHQSHPRPEIFSPATGPRYIYSLAAPAAFPSSSPSPSAPPPFIPGRTCRAADALAPAREDTRGRRKEAEAPRVV